MKTEYVYDSIYFWKKFSAIPEARWCTNWHFDGMGRSCAFGHTMNENSFEYTSRVCKALTDEGIKLKALFIHHFKSDCAVVNINNGVFPQYQQPTPRLRIIAALEDIIVMEGKTLPGKEVSPKVVYKTVVIDTKVKELTETELSQQ